MIKYHIQADKGAAMMKTKGKKFVCRSCKKVTTVNFKKEVPCFIFGDEEVRERTRITRLLSGTDEKDNPDYHYEVGYCESCYAEHHNPNWESPQEILALISKIEKIYQAHINPLKELFSREADSSDADRIITLLDEYAAKSKEAVEQLKTAMQSAGAVYIYSPSYTDDVDKEIDYPLDVYPASDTPREKYHIEKRYTADQILDMFVLNMDTLPEALDTETLMAYPLYKRIREESIE